MNKVLIEIAKKVLLIPIVKANLERICQFYATPTRPTLKQAFIESHAKALDNKNQLDLEGTFLGEDDKALEKLVNMVIKDRIMVVEVGSWKGFATSVLTKAVADYNGKVFAVDHWMGSEANWEYEEAKVQDVYSIFKRNMIILGVWDMVHPLVTDSQTASQIFADGILDLVFIDADHRYDYVKKDISSWLPKLRDGGILCGHDCEGYYSGYSEEAKGIINQHLEDDYISVGDNDTPNMCHPGVVKALHDYFHEKYQIMPNTRVWYYVK